MERYNWVVDLILAIWALAGTAGSVAGYATNRRNARRDVMEDVTDDQAKAIDALKASLEAYESRVELYSKRIEDQKSIIVALEAERDELMAMNRSLQKRIVELESRTSTIH